MNLNTDRSTASLLAYLKDPTWHKGGREGERKESCNIWKRLCTHREKSSKVEWMANER